MNCKTKKICESKVFSLNSGKADKAFAQLKIIDEGQSLSNINFKFDTGSQINAIPKYFFDKEFRNVELKPTYILLTACGGSNLRPISKCNLTFVYKNVLDVLDFFIVNCKSPPILGLKGCQEIGLAKLSFNVKSTITKLPNIVTFVHEFRDLKLKTFFTAVR